MTRPFYAPSSSAVRPMLERQVRKNIKKIQGKIDRCRAKERRVQEIVKDKSRCMAIEKQLLNSLRPINTLPNEILLRIFTFYIKSVPLKRRIPYNAVTLTHVCDRWRAVSIGCPSLWNEVNLQWPSWTRKLVERSQKVMLRVALYKTERSTLFFKTSTAWKNSVQDYVFNQCADRIGHLHIYAIYTHLPTLLTKLPRNMSALRGLILASSCPTDYPKPANIIPDFIFHLPQIQTIRLDGTWPLKKPLLWFQPTLQKLNLRLPDADECRMPVQDVMKALSLMPQLKYLTLANICTRDVTHVPSYPRVVLSSLVFLFLADVAVNCLAFLEHINTPSLEALRIDSPHCKTRIELDNLCSLIVSKIGSNPALPPFTRLALAQQVDSLSLEAYSNIEYPNSSIPKPRGRSQLRVYIGFSFGQPDSHEEHANLWRLTSGLDLSHVQELILELGCDLGASDYHLFSRLTSVSTLSVLGQTIRQLPEILRYPYKDDLSRDGDPVMPNIKKLMLIDVDDTDWEDADEVHLERKLTQTFSCRPPPDSAFELHLQNKHRDEDESLVYVLASSLFDGICAMYAKALRDKRQSAIGRNQTNIWVQQLEPVLMDPIRKNPPVSFDFGGPFRVLSLLTAIKIWIE